MNHTLIIAALALLAPSMVKAVATDTIPEVVITGSREQTDVRYLPHTVTIIDKETLQHAHSSNLISAIESLVPNMFVTKTSMLGYGVSIGSAGNISMRGLSGSAAQVLIMVDGHPQFSGIYGHPIPDSYQTLIAERVEVLHSPASVLYGSNAMGGVINIVTKNNNTQGTTANIDISAGSWGTVIADASVYVNQDRLSCSVASQYSRSDNHRPNMEFEQFSGDARIAYRLNDNWNIYAHGNVSGTKSEYPGPIQEPMLETDRNIRRGMVSAGIDNKYNRTNGSISAYTSFGRHTINDGYKDNSTETPQSRLFQSKDNLSGISVYQNLNLFTGNRLTAGFEYQHIFGDTWYTSRVDGSVLDTPNKQSACEYMNQAAGYIDMSQNLGSILTLSAGIRFDHHSVSGIEWIPQAGVAVRTTDNSTLKLSYAKGFRNPTIKELYMYPPSNDSLQAERINSFELSWKHTPDAGPVKYGINLFYIKGDNMIQTVMMKNINTGAIENYGVEFNLMWKIAKHWSLSTNHGWVNMKHPIISVPQYKGMLRAMFHSGKWNANVELQQICGLYSQLSSKENYTLLNAGIDYQILDGIGLWIKGENLLAQKYQINYGYPMPRATFMCGASFKL
ncbi:MAG: TonB-dependent receptor [Bacteroidaceae bacterium]|nr:TonB-dependent receptor [Bacteroidaceae bacterium]